VITSNLITPNTAYHDTTQQCNLTWTCQE